MGDFRTDLKNEFQNQKYYLEQDLVRLVNSPVTSYKGRLDEIKDCFVEISKINIALEMVDVYLPEEAQQENAPVPNPETEGDVVTGVGNQPAPSPQPLQGQSHAE